MQSLLYMKYWFHCKTTVFAGALAVVILTIEVGGNDEVIVL